MKIVHNKYLTNKFNKKFNSLLIIFILIIIVCLFYCYYTDNKNNNLNRNLNNNLTNNLNNNLKKNSKFYRNIDDAIKDIKDGSSISIGGFNLNGIPNTLITRLSKKNVKNLTCVSIQVGEEKYGTNLLIYNNQVKKLITGYVGKNKYITKLYLSGELEIEFIPIGTLSEKLRSGGSGIPAFYTPTGCDNIIEYGEIPLKYNKKGEVIEYNKKKEFRYFNNKKYLLEESISTDFSFVKAWKGDQYGNLVFRGTAQNFNHDCAKSGKICIAEVEEFIEDGELNPNEIDIPGIFVNRIVKSNNMNNINLQILNNLNNLHNLYNLKNINEEDLKINKIIKRAAKEIKNGMYVNLGVGIPTKIPNFLHPDIAVNIHNENGLLGIGNYQNPHKFNSNIVNVGNEPINFINGSSTFSLSDSFSMIRGGYIDVTILGAFEVSSHGDISNWTIPNEKINGIGGSLDLIAGAKKIIIIMMHSDKNGNPKIVEKCKYPITAKGIVDLLITELAVFEFDKDGMVLIEYSKDTNLATIKEKTGANFRISPNLVITK